MKKVYIIHGWEGTPTSEPMNVWLKQQLEDKGYMVSALAMPETDHPKIAAWVGALQEAISEPYEDTILIGHSIGCQTILRFVAGVASGKFAGVVLIAPWVTLTPEALPDEESKEIAKPWIETPMPSSGQVWNHIAEGQVFAIFSDNDPDVPFEENRKWFEEKYNPTIIIENNKGHFTTRDKVQDLPSALEAVLKM